jgi:type IV pilus assembly protein PilY1
MLQDMNVVTQSFVAGATLPKKDIPVSIKYDDLYDFTDNPYGTNLTTTERNNLDLLVSAKSGWRFDYASSGEKSTAGALVINGVAYFTSFTPGGDSGNACELLNGEGALYAIDLYEGKNALSMRKNIILAGMPDTPVITVASTTHTPVDPSLPVDPNAPPGLAPGEVGLVVPQFIGTGTTLETARTYQYVTENQ